MFVLTVVVVPLLVNETVTETVMETHKLILTQHVRLHVYGHRIVDGHRTVNGDGHGFDASSRFTHENLGW